MPVVQAIHLFLLASSSAAVTLPDGAAFPVRGSVELLVGKSDDLHARGGGARLLLPLGRVLGLGVDASLGELGDDEVEGGALRLWWRSRQKALRVGLGVESSQLGSLDERRATADLEWFADAVSLAGSLGYQEHDSPARDDALVGSLAVRWFPARRVQLEAGAIQTGGNTIERLGVEVDVGGGRGWRASFAAESSWDEEEHESAVATLRFRFGGEGTLRDRVRDGLPELPLR